MGMPIAPILGSVQPASIPVDWVSWVVGALTLAWLLLVVIFSRLRRVVTRHGVRVFLARYAGVGGVCGSVNVVLFASFFIRPGVSWRNAAMLVPLVVYFLLTAALWPPWLIRQLSGTSFGGPPS